MEKNKRDYNKTLMRLYEILQRLNDGEALSIKSLAEEFDVSYRTIQRDMNDRLSKMYPIYQEKRLWRMQKNFKIENQNSSEDDLILGIIGKLTEGMGQIFSAKVKKLLSKIYNQKNNPIYAKNSMEDISTHLDEINKITQSIESKTHITCIYTKYQDRSRKRKIKPLKIVTFEGFWYLVGLNENNKIRKYYLKNISNIYSTKEIFKTDIKIDKMLENAVSIWFNSEKKAFKVRLLADVDVAKYFKRKPLPTQKIEDELEDGSIIFSIDVTNDKEVISLVKYRLPHLHILEPLWIKESIENDIKRFLS